MDGWENLLPESSQGWNYLIYFYFLWCFLVPQRRKETVMVAQTEETDGAPVKKSQGTRFLLKRHTCQQLTANTW